VSPVQLGSLTGLSGFLEPTAAWRRVSASRVSWSCWSSQRLLVLEAEDIGYDVVQVLGFNHQAGHLRVRRQHPEGKLCPRTAGGVRDSIKSWSTGCGIHWVS